MASGMNAHAVMTCNMHTIFLGHGNNTVIIESRKSTKRNEVIMGLWCCTALSKIVVPGYGDNLKAKLNTHCILLLNTCIASQFTYNKIKYILTHTFEKVISRVRLALSTHRRSLLGHRVCTSCAVADVWRGGTARRRWTASGRV